MLAHEHPAAGAEQAGTRRCSGRGPRDQITHLISKGCIITWHATKDRPLE